MPSKISTPLTVIALFSGLAESFATATLIFLPADTQRIFIYFVMLFPLFLVSLFFWVLRTKPEALYAPSDYQDERLFIEAQGLRDELRSQLFNAIQTNDKAPNDLKLALINDLDHLIQDTPTPNGNRQDQILNQLTTDTQKTTQEISEATGIHPSYTHTLLNKLSQAGRIRRIPGPPITWQLIR